MKILHTSVLGLACATALVSSVGVSPAQAAQPDESADPHVALLSEYNRYWTPKPFDKQNFDTAFRGNVTPQGSKILARNDEGVEQINKAGLTRRAKPLTDRADPSSGVPCAMPRCLRTRCKKITIPSARCLASMWPRGSPSAPRRMFTPVASPTLPGSCGRQGFRK